MSQAVLDTEDREIIKSWYLPRLKLSHMGTSYLLVSKKCTVPLPVLCAHLPPARVTHSVLLRSDLMDYLLFI